MTFSYELTTDVGRVRLLLNDIAEDDHVFSDEELYALLEMENNHVKLAAAQAIDTNADNQALALKVLQQNTVSTNGAKLAEALRARAATLRDQHYRAVSESEEDGYFSLVSNGRPIHPELTSYWF